MMFTSGKMPWVRLQQFFNREEDKLVKSHTHLKKRLEKICWKKMKKPHKLSGNWDKKDKMAKRFQEHLQIHIFLVVFLFLVIIFLQMLLVVLF